MEAPSELAARGEGVAPFSECWTATAIMESGAPTLCKDHSLRTPPDDNDLCAATTAPRDPCAVTIARPEATRTIAEPMDLAACCAMTDKWISMALTHPRS